MRTPGELAAQAGEEVYAQRIVDLEAAGARFKRLVQEEVAIALSNIQDFVEVAEGGELSFIPFSEIPKKKLKAIKKIKETTRITESKDGQQLFKESKVELELWDKPGMLANLHKLRGDYPADKHEHDIPANSNLAALLEEDRRQDTRPAQ